MARDDYLPTARSLALPIDSPTNDLSPSHTRRSNDYTWHRRSTDSAPLPPTSRRAKWQQQMESYNDWVIRFWNGLSLLQKTGLVLLNIGLFVLGILFLVYNQRLFAYLSPGAKKWRELPGGWLILWLLVVAVSFPPMVGFSQLTTIAGFVFGMNGWWIMATATTVGSTAAFLVSRGVLRNFVARLTERNKQFAALSLVIKHDGLKLLAMIRLCPLPYSLSNGAISTIPTVSWQNMGLATAIASPRLLVGVFIGSRLGDLAENGDKMDAKSKTISLISVVIGISLGIGTGYYVWNRVKARARQLEAEEASGEAHERRRSVASGGFADDVDERAAAGVFRSSRRESDNYSMHTTYEDDLEGGLDRGGGDYRDEFTDDEDAVERDVFDEGDGK